MDDNLNKELKDYDILVKAEKFKTDLVKKRFINEITNGLGEAIKKYPNVADQVQPKKVNKVKAFFEGLIKIFT